MSLGLPCGVSVTTRVFGLNSASLSRLPRGRADSPQIAAGFMLAFGALLLCAATLCALPAVGPDDLLSQ